MRFLINKRLTLIILLFIFIVWISAIIAVNIEYCNKYSNYLAYRDEIFENAVLGVIKTYESFSNFIFISAIDNDLIKSYLYKANHGDEDTKSLMRKQLAKDLDETHRTITEYNFRQFHFQLANGDSFYRFHIPEKYGDNLLDIRESMKVANIEKRYIAGFEEGRIFSGYRFVYPLNYQGEHVGSIEISISPSCILEELYELESQKDLGFILAKEIMEETVFDDQQSRYKTSLISNDFVSDIEVSSLIDKQRDSLKLLHNPAFVSKLKDIIDDKLYNNRSFNDAMSFDNKVYLIQFQIINDISSRPVGYFFCFKEDTQIEAIQTAKKVVLALATTIMATLAFLVIYAFIRQREVHKMAMTDQLTKIYNRHSFYELAKKEVARADRNEENISFGIIDIDFFKKVNDNFGHATGDEVLKTVAKIISSSIRITDLIARHGGEEFVLLMPSTSAKDANVVAERIRNTIENYKFDKIGKLTVSIGISEKAKKEKIEDTINRADIALYKAKENGRNRIVTEYY